MSVEVVFMVPILVMFTMLVLVGGRYVSVRADIDAAARDAARAASMERTVYGAQAAALSAVQLADDNFSDCQLTEFSGSFVAGGIVTVGISCRVSNRGLGLLGLGDSRVFEASSSAPLDEYRRFG